MLRVSANMDEIFEHNGLLTREALRELQARDDRLSVTRLGLHTGALVLLGWLTLRVANEPVLALGFSIALAWVWATIFAPFHECTHRTAFRSRRANAIGAWLTAIPFGMAPAVYRAFHFEHHRHTQDPARDPEIMENPHVFSSWPTSFFGWLIMCSGYGLIVLKCRPMFGFATTPTASWDERVTWIPPLNERRALARECRLLLALWIAFFIACIVTDGGGWLLFALLLAHVFESLWLVAEHTGLPLRGTITERTRSVETNAFVRWWLWNMNYHTEHHAWPGVPWHRLDDAHRRVVDKLEHNANSYTALHREVLATRDPL